MEKQADAGREKERTEEKGRDITTGWRGERKQEKGRRKKKEIEKT